MYKMTHEELVALGYSDALNGEDVESIHESIRINMGADQAAAYLEGVNKK